MKKLPLLSCLILLFLLLASRSIDAQESDSFLHLKPIKNSSENKDLSDFSVSYHSDDSNISILNFTGNYDRSLNGSLNIEARQAVTQAFYNHQSDQYDFLVIFTKFQVDSGEAAAFNISYENDVAGIGLPLFDNSLDMGSERLQSTIDMTELSDWELNPGNRNFDKTLGVLMHEMMHRWGVFVTYENNMGQVSDLTLGRNGAHWNYFLNTNASLMYGALWKDLGTAVFETQATRKLLSPLDLYLMGFKAPSSVPDFFLIDQGMPGDRNDVPAQIGTQASGNRVDISINDIIAAEGVRIPAAEDAQHKFNFKFILLKTPDQELNANDIGNLVVLQREFQKRFFAETAGLGEVVYPSSSNQYENQNPAGLIYNPITNAAVDLNAAELFLVNRLTTNNWQDKPATQVRDTAVAIQALQNLGQSDTASIGSAWLNQYQASNNDELAWQLLSNVLNPTKKAQIIDQLQTQMNGDGGWGLSNDSESSVYDSALVVNALKSALGDQYSPSAATRIYISSQQNVDYGAGYTSHGKSSLLSSLMLLSIIFDVTQNEQSEQMLIDYILDKQLPDGGFGSNGMATVHETALAIEVLLSTNQQNHNQAIDEAKAKLASMQSIDGSFAGSVYSTALALQALFNDFRPNLSLNSVNLSNTEAVAGEQIAVQFDVSHLNNNAAVDIPVALYFQQQLVATKILPQVPADQSVNDYLVFETTGLVGEQALTVVIDEADLLSESNEADNEIEVSFTVQPQTSLPELVIDWSTLNYQPKFFDSLPINLTSTLTVSNLSSTGIDGVKVSIIRLNDDLSQTVLQSYTENFGANETRPFSFDVMVNEASNALNFLLVVDPENIVDESNEQNNQVDFNLPKESSIDLNITTEQISLPEQFILGQQSNISFEFSNNGTESSPSFDAKVLYQDTQDQVEIYSSLILEMDGGETISREFSWVPPRSGEFDLVFILDDNDLVPEVNEANNAITIPINISANGNTNLLINDEDISISPDPGLTGQLITINALVKNNSNVSSGLFDVNFYQQTADSASELIATAAGNTAIEPAGEVNVEITLTDFSLAGEVTFIVEIDPVDVIAEFNENDNVAFKAFQILNKPDARVSSGGFILSPSDPVLGSPLNVQVTTANIGQQQLLNAELKLYTQSGDQLTEVATETIAVINGGQSYSSSFDFIFPNDSALSALVARVDEDDLIDEISETNNQATLMIENQNQDFYVTEKYFSPDGDGTKDQTQIVFNLDDSDDYRIQIIDEFNQVVRDYEIFNNTSYGDVFWDGRNNKQKIVRDGDYAVSISGLNSNYQNTVYVVLDTNRYTISESIVNADDFFVDLTCSLHDIRGHFFSLDGKYIYATYYENLNEEAQLGLFAIKADGTEIKSLLPESFYSTRNRRVNQFISMNDGMLLTNFSTTQSVDELWVIDPVDRSYEQLNTDGVSDFRVSEATEHAIIISVTGDPSSYYLISKNPSIEPVLMNFPLSADEYLDFNFAGEFLVWSVSSQSENQNETTVYSASYDQVINNPNQIINLGAGGMAVSSDQSLFVLNATDALVFFKKQNQQLAEVAFIPKTDSIEARHFEILPNNDVLVLADANITIYNSTGDELIMHPHKFSYEYIQQSLIEEYGSLDRIAYLGEAPLEFYSLSDVQNIKMSYIGYELNWGSEREIYLKFRMALTGYLDLSEFGIPEPSEVHINSMIIDEPEQFKINYVSLEAIDVVNLESMNVVDSKLYEKLSPYFNNYNSFYLKQQLAEPSGIDTSFWNDYSPASAKAFSPSSSADYVNKILVKSDESPETRLCVDSGDEFIGVYQSSKNLTAFIQAQAEQSGVKITGSAFDHNFAHYLIEYRKTDQPSSSWNQIMTSTDQVFTGLLAYWSPELSGNYQLRLTVVDQAGNQRSDLTDLFVGSYNASITNVDVGPKFFSPNGDGVIDSVKIDYEVTQSTELEIQITDKFGQTVKTITREYIGGDHHESISWDGTNQLGQVAANGEYFINVRGFVFDVYLDTVLPSYQSQPKLRFIRDKDFVSGYNTTYKPFVVSVGYDHDHQVTDQPDSITYPENKIDDEYQIHDTTTDAWLGANLPLPSGYDPFTPMNLSKPQYRHVMTDQAGNQYISPTFSYPNRMFSAELVVKSVDQRRAVIPLTQDCGRPICEIKSQSVDMTQFGRGFDLSDGKRLAWVIQAYDTREVAHVVLETTVDGQLQNTEMKHFSETEIASDFFNSEDILSNDGLPAKMMKLSNFGKPTYVYVLELESDDIITEFSSEVSYALKVIGVDNAELDSVNFKTKNGVRGPNLIVEEVTEYVGVRQPPDFLINYLNRLMLPGALFPEFEEITKGIWLETINGLIKQPEKRYFLGYELRKYQTDEVLTENNTLDVKFLNANLNQFDSLPIVTNQAVKDQHSYQAVLFSFDAETCKQINSIEWKFLGTDLQPGGQLNSSGFGSSELCFTGEITQAFQAHEMCNQSATINTQISLLVNLERIGGESEIASVELFSLVDGEESLIMVDTNPVISAAGDLNYSLNLDTQNLAVGQSWVLFKVNDVEGNVWKNNFPIYINNSNAIPEIITPSINNQSYCAQDTETGLITVPLLANISTNQPYHVSVNLLHQGVPEELINDAPVQYGLLNSIYTLARGYDFSEPLLQEFLEFRLGRYSGPTELMVETMSSTGVSSCDTVTIEVDSKVDVLTQFEEGFQYLSPNNDGVKESMDYGSVSAIENIQVETFLQYVPSDNSGTVDLGFLDMSVVLAGEDITLSWDGFYEGEVVVDGHYKIQVSITDDCGISKKWLTDFIIDTTFPVSNFENPQNGQDVAAIIDVSVDISEAHLDTDSVKLAYQFNGIWTPLAIENLTPTAATDHHDVLTGWSLSQLPAGQYPLKLTAADLAGNESEASITVNHLEAQNIFWNFALNHRYISPNNDGINDVVDINIGLNINALVSLRVEDEYQNIVKVLQTETQLVQGSHVIEWSGFDDLEQVLADGNYRIIVTAEEVGNPAHVESLDISVNLDNTPPLIELSSMNPIIKGEGLLTVSLEDFNFRSAQVWLQQVEPMEAEQIIADINVQGTTDLLDLTTLDESKYEIRVLAQDLAGNSQSLVHVFEVDNTVPVLSIETPADLSFQGGLTDSILVAGEIIDKNFANFQVFISPDTDPLVWGLVFTGDSLESDNFSAEWPISTTDGIYKIRVLAVDHAGLETEKIVQINIDTQAPITLLSNPTTDSLQGTLIDVNGTVSDENLSSFMLSFKRADEDDTRWVLIHSGVESSTNTLLYSWPHNLPSADYNLRLRAEDFVGLESETIVRFNVDSQAPLDPLFLTGELSNDVVTLEWQVSPSIDVAGYRIYRNGSVLNNGLESSGLYTDSGLAEGEFTYWVVAVDHAGNVSMPSNSVNIVVDNTAPQVLILSPVNGALVSGVIDILGSTESTDDFLSHHLYYREVQDSPPGTLLVQSSLPSTGGLMASIDSESLIHDAQYIIRLEARDINQNISVVEHSITVDNQAPAAPVNLSYNVNNVNDVTLNWNANSEADLAGYLLYRNNEIISGSGSIDSSIITTTSYSDDDVVDGIHTYHVVAIDFSQNISLISNSVEVQIDQNVPHALIVSPAPDTEFEHPVSLIAESDDLDIEQVSFEYSTDGLAWFAFYTDSSAPFEAVFDANEFGLSYGIIHFRAIAKDQAQQVDTSAEEISLVHTDLTPPLSIAQLNGLVTGADVQLNWAANTEPDLAGYVVSRKQILPIQEDDYTLISQPIVEANLFIDSSLTEGTYLYRVAAIDEYENQSSWVNSQQLIVFSITLKQPYSPVLTPVSINVEGFTDYAGTVSGSITNVAGTTTLQAIEVDTSGQFLYENLSTEVGDNQFSVAQSTSDGHSSIVSNVTVQVSPVAEMPVNALAAVTGYELSYSWESPNINTIGYVPYINQQPFESTEPLEENLTVLTSSNSFSANRAIDGINDTYWSPSYDDRTDGIPVFYELSLNEPKWITRVDLHWSENSTSGAYQPSNYLLEYLSPVGWITQSDFSGNQSTVVSYQSNVPYLTQAIRVWMPLGDANETSIRLNEVVVLHQPFINQTNYVSTLLDGEHEFQVSAINNYGFESQLTSPQTAVVGDVVAPEAVTLTATVQNIDTAALQWTASSSTDVAFYRIYREGELVYVSPDADTLNYLDMNLPNGVHQYQVVVVDTANNPSEFSNIVEVEIDQQILDPPTGLVISMVESGQILNLTWDEVTHPEFSHYFIFRSLSVSSDYELIGQSTTAGYIDDGLVNGTRYYYYLTVVDQSDNQSLPSEVVSGMPLDALSPNQPVITQPTTSGFPISVNSLMIDVSGYGSPAVEVELYQQGLLLDTVTSSSGFSVSQLNLSDYFDDIKFNQGNLYFAGYDFFSGSVVIVNPENDSYITVNESDVREFFWSVDGSHLYTISGYGSESKIKSFGVNGIEFGTLYSGFNISNALIKEDGSQLFYWGDGINSDTSLTEEGLWIYSFNNEDYQKINLNGSITVDQQAMRWLPNGDLAFINFPNGINSPGELWYHEGQNGQLSLLEANTAPTSTLSSNNEGTYLYYTVIVNGNEGINRYRLADGDVTVYSQPGVDVSMPVANQDIDQVLININCCDKALINLISGETLEFFADTGFQTTASWLADGRILYFSSNLDFSGLNVVNPPGVFKFNDVELSSGSNEFYVVARKNNGLVSPISEPILVTLNEAVLADLEIKANYLQILPSQVFTGESLTGTVLVKNNSQIDVEQARLLIEIIDPNFNSQFIAPAPLDFSLAAGELLAENFTTGGLDDSGEYTIRVFADSNQQVLESNENNNAVFKVVRVVDNLDMEFELVLSSDEVLPGDDLQGNIRVYNPSSSVFDGAINLRITDDAGFSVGYEQTFAVEGLEGGSSWEHVFDWSSEDVFAGDYLVEATLHDQNQQFIESQVENFTINEVAEFLLSLSSTASQVRINQNINLIADIDYQFGNINQSGTLHWEVLNSAEQLIWSETSNTSNMSPGFNGSIEQSWTAEQTGAFQAKVTLITPLVEVTANIPIDVLPDEAELSLAGLLTDLSAAITLGQAWNSFYSIQNNGQIDVANIPITIALWDSQLTQMLAQEVTVISLTVGANSQLSNTWQSSNLSVGNYILVLSADLSAIGGSSDYLLDTQVVQTADITGPQIDVINPVEQGFYPANFEFRTVVSDLHAEVGAVDVTIDSSAEVSFQGQQINDSYQYWLTGLSEGPHELNVRATDTYGNVNDQNLNFYVDSTSPLIDVSGVSNGGLYNNSISANVGITDINLSSSQIILDGVPYISGTPITVEGSHLLMVSASDLAGNTANERVVFNLDLTPPAVVISFPENNSETNQATTTISGTTEVNAQLMLSTGNYTESVNADFEGNFSFTSVPLDSGNNTINIQATDLAGNTGMSMPVNVTLVDNISVSGLISADNSHGLGQNLPAAWQITNLTNFPVSQLPVELNLYSTKSNQLVRSDSRQVSIEAMATTADNTVFTTDDLSPGSHRLELRVEIEQSWQVLSDQLIVLQDVLGPDLVVVEPMPGQVSQSTVDLWLQATDAHSEVESVSYQLDNTVDWLPMTFNGNAYVEQLELTNGPHQLIFKARDLFGNETLTPARGFNVDTMGPDINVNSPVDGLITNQPVNISFTITDDHDFSVSALLNQSPVAEGDLVVEEGEYELVVSAIDEVNNQTEVTRDFIIDTTAPVVTVTNPVNGSQNTTGSLDIIGQAEERNFVSIVLNGVETILKSSESGDFSLSNQALQVGMNTIVVTATDQAGNVSQSVTRDVDYIQVGSIAGRVWQDDDQNSVIGMGELGFNQVSLKVTDNDQISQQAQTDSQGHFQFAGLAPGSYTIEVIEESLLNDWIITTNNNPSSVDVPVDQEVEINFGFFQEKPSIATSARANDITGRILLLVDPPTAQINNAQCFGVTGYQLKRYFEADFTVGDVVWAKLYDDQGTLLQTESGTYSDFINNGHQSIDQQAETNAYNLVLHPIENSHIKASVHSSNLADPEVIYADYSVQLGIETATGVHQWASSLVLKDCQLFELIGQPLGELQVASVGLNPPLVSDDPNGSNEVPHLIAQQALLEEMLIDAGWSFQITSDANEFGAELATGQYVSYALLAENVGLSNQIQNNLMNAVEDGAGLMVSSGHDNLSTQFYSSMGIDVSGTHSTATELVLSDSVISSSEVLAIEHNEQVMKVSLTDASSAGKFNGPGISPPNNQAVTWLDGENGSAVFSGMDWLSQATDVIGLNPYTELFKSVLNYIHPLGLSNELGYARAVQLKLQNNGRPVEGYIQVLLPAGVEFAHAEIPVTLNQDGFIFDYALLEDQVLDLEFWLTINNSPSTVTFEVYLNNEPSIFESLDITLVAGESANLSTSITNCQAGVRPDQALMYRFQITNTGNKAINSAQAFTDFDLALANPVWTCSGSFGGNCNQNSGTGNLSGQGVDLPVGSSASFIFSTRVLTTSTAAIMPSAHVLMPPDISDIYPLDNMASDYDAVYEFIFKNGVDCAAAGQESLMIQTQTAVNGAY